MNNKTNIKIKKKVEKSEFLAYFYKKSMCVLLAPLMANTVGGKIIRGKIISELNFIFLN